MPPGSATHRSTVTALSTAWALAATSVTVRLAAQAVLLHGIEVVGVRVAAAQIGRFPDEKIGDAMKRIPGIAVPVDQREARFGLIRGTEPRLNSITLNGERVPSAEGEVLAMQFDLIPADMVQSIEVNKAVTPDLDADAIGASVNTG